MKHIHLDWPVTIICDSDSYAFSSFVNSNSAMIVAFMEDDGTRDLFGSVFRRLESGKGSLGRDGEEGTVESSFEVSIFGADGVVDSYKEDTE